jgi:hypothetical protein
MAKFLRLGGDRADTPLAGAGVQVSYSIELAAAAKADLKSEIAELKSDLKAGIARLEANFHKTMTAQTWRVIGFLVVGTAFVQCLVKFLA